MAGWQLVRLAPTVQIRINAKGSKKMGLRSLTLTAVAGLIVAACVLTTSRPALADPASDARVPIPNAAVRKAGEKAVDDVFGADIAAAKTDAARAAVAKKIWDLAREEKDLSHALRALEPRGQARGFGRRRAFGIGCREGVGRFLSDRQSCAEVATIRAIERCSSTRRKQPSWPWRR